MGASKQAKYLRLKGRGGPYDETDKNATQIKGKERKAKHPHQPGAQKAVNQATSLSPPFAENGAETFLSSENVGKKKEKKERIVFCRAVDSSIFEL